MNVCGAGATLDLDTALFPDGDYELRVVGIEDSPIESQGRQIIAVRFNNYARTIHCKDSPAQVVRAGQPITLTAEAPGVRGVAFFNNKRKVALVETDRDEW